MCGQMARALASGRPISSPRRAAASSSAEICSALFCLATTMLGSQGLFDAFASRQSAVENALAGAALPRKSWRLMRSVGRRGSHRLRIRRRFLEKALITFPFHDPPPDRAMTIADKLRVEHRRAPRAARCAGGECAARTIHRVSAVEGNGSAASRSIRPVTPDARAASVSLRLATRSSCRARPRLPSPRRLAHRRPAHRRPSATRCPRRPRAPSPAARIEAEFGQSAHRQRARIRFRQNPAAPRPAAAAPLTPARASPATKNPVAAALCRPSANTSCIAPMARPPCSAASAST